MLFVQCEVLLSFQLLNLKIHGSSGVCIEGLMDFYVSIEKAFVDPQSQSPIPYSRVSPLFSQLHTISSLRPQQLVCQDRCWKVCGSQTGHSSDPLAGSWGQLGRGLRSPDLLARTNSGYYAVTFLGHYTAQNVNVTICHYEYLWSYQDVWASIPSPYSIYQVHVAKKPKTPVYYPVPCTYPTQITVSHLWHLCKYNIIFSPVACLVNCFRLKPSKYIVDWNLINRSEILEWKEYSVYIKECLHSLPKVYTRVLSLWLGRKDINKVVLKSRIVCKSAALDHHRNI